MRDPCPHCGLPGMARSRYDHWIKGIVRDIEDHDCPAFARYEPLPSEPTDTSFIWEARNSQEGLAAYREYLARQK